LAMMYEQYERLIAEIKNQEKIERKEMTRLNKDGSEKAYNLITHMDLVERAANLAEKLMKYGYTPAKDDDDDTPTPTLNINLTTDNTTFTLNPRRDDE